jgi:type II secretory pathway pseudopilin PulG
VSRARGEEGYVVAVTVLVLGIILAMAGAAVALAVRSVDTSNRDKRAARSLAAADAGLDVAHYRLNRTLLATKKLGLSPPSTTTNLDDVLAIRDCLLVTIGGSTPGTKFGTILASGETVCAATEREPLGDGTSFSYRVANRFTIGTVPEILTRQVLATGHGPRGTQRRVLGTFRTRVNPLDKPTTLFRLWRYVECSAQPSDPTNPFSGCPYTGP